MADYKFIDSAVIHGGISTDPYTQSVNVQFIRPQLSDRKVSV